ncbi:MAG: hypothetical protein ABIL02_04515 [candidate division WOR-3 bacterium]
MLSKLNHYRVERLMVVADLGLQIFKSRVNPVRILRLLTGWLNGAISGPF